MKHTPKSHFLNILAITTFLSVLQLAGCLPYAMEQSIREDVYRSAERLYKDGDYPAAIAQFQKVSADTQNGFRLHAMERLGFMYYEGKGVQRNIQMAMSWADQPARRGAEGYGYTCSQNLIGYIYLSEPALQNTQTAAYWLLRAAENPDQFQGQQCSDQARANLRVPDKSMDSESVRKLQIVVLQEYITAIVEKTKNVRAEDNLLLANYKAKLAQLSPAAAIQQEQTIREGQRIQRESSQSNAEILNGVTRTIVDEAAQRQLEKTAADQAEYDRRKQEAAEKFKREQEAWATRVRANEDQRNQQSRRSGTDRCSDGSIRKTSSNAQDGGCPSGASPDIIIKK